MRVTAVYDVEGLILAAVITEEGYNGPLPVAAAGLALGVFDVPSRSDNLPEGDGRQLEAICVGHRVDVTSKTLRLS